jgi:hypothetical protein
MMKEQEHKLPVICWGYLLAISQVLCKHMKFLFVLYALWEKQVKKLVLIWQGHASEYGYHHKNISN